ncbi:unnamed protein product, partial [Ectocarpus sp. 12 AP-2014]
MAATECLVGCMLQDISPFDDENEVVWDQREACDSTTVGCEVSAINYPGTFFRGALWAQTSGTDGSSDCRCDICDPYPSTGPVFYMSEEVSLWSRIQCYIAASEASGYDMSPCVAAVMDTGTLLCVEEAYEAPLIDQFACDANSIDDIETTSIAEGCIWEGDTRQSADMFSGADPTVLTPAPDTPSPTPTPPTVGSTPSPPVSPTTSPGVDNISPTPTPTPGTTKVPTLGATSALDTPSPTIVKGSTPGPSAVTS